MHLKEQIKKYSPIVFGLILIIFVIHFVFKNKENIDLILNIDLKFITGLTLINLPYFFFLGFGQNEALKTQGVKLHFKEWYGLCVVTTFLNLFLPAKGGVVVRALYLKDAHQLEYKKFTLSTIYHIFIGSIMWSFIGFSTFTLLPEQYTSSINFMILFFFVGVILSLLFLYLPSKYIGQKLNFINKWKELHNKKTFIKIAFSFFMIFIFDIIRMQLSFYSIGIELSIVQAALSSIALLALLSTPFVPGNLGVREASFAFVYSMWGIDIDKALLASLIDRCIYSSVMIILGLPYYFYFTKKTSQKTQL